MQLTELDLNFIIERACHILQKSSLDPLSTWQILASYFPDQRPTV
jgi:hypothetical protein